MKKRDYHFLIDEGLMAKFDAKLGGETRTAVVVQLMRDFIGGKERGSKPEDLDLRDRVRIYDNEVKISKIVNDYAIKALKDRGSGVFEGLSDSELAKLVISQLPKPKDVDEDLKHDMLSLRAALDRLPGMEDVTAELNKTKFELNRLKSERAIEVEMFKGIRKRLNGDKAGAWEDFKRGLELAVKQINEIRSDAEERGIDFSGYRIYLAGAE